MTSRSKISQREAVRLRKRVRELEEQDRERKRCFSSDYPGGVNIATIDISRLERELGRIEGVQMTHHMLVARVSGSSLRLFAVRA